MKCKHCQAELEETMRFCPVCGTARTEEPAEETVQETVPVEEVAPETVETTEPEIKEGIKATPGKIALAIVAGVVVSWIVDMIVDPKPELEAKLNAQLEDNAGRMRARFEEVMLEVLKRRAREWD